MQSQQLATLAAAAVAAVEDIMLAIVYDIFSRIWIH